ncbi:hypothetical protein GF362_02450 [Candidatus Dojkabacteria bacterium]|nr:hypothetical protein [Candidatus Dojkabacteria bacterium]
METAEITCNLESETDNTEIVPVSDYRHLIQILTEYGVPIEQWTFGQIFELAQLIQIGDTRLASRKNKLLQLKEGVNINVFSPTNESILLEQRRDRYNVKDELVETKSTQGYSLSIGETKKQGETFKESAIRGLQEELGIEEITGLEYANTYNFTKLLTRTPGLPAEYTIKEYNYTIPEHYYNPEGYEVIEPDTAYMRIPLSWEPVENF